MAHEQSKLVKQVTGMLLTQFKNFPNVERSYIIIASIEALAWISAMETVSHCKEVNEGPEEAKARILHYSQLFSSNAARGLPEALQMKITTTEVAVSNEASIKEAYAAKNDGEALQQRISAAEATIADSGGVKEANVSAGDKAEDTNDEITGPSPESVLAGGSS
ncbi:MAG: hypothetical protein COB37_11240 [Kordiimonadales bacterium]|nr:MAG: hypothetical protein COB37_11240 [Kordiimonadales bacterium]